MSMGAINSTASPRRCASEALVTRHAELVKRIAYHLARRLPASVDVADLIQSGMLGLLEAGTRYASDRGAVFETFAGIRIRGAMIDTLRKLDWTPRSVHRKARAVAIATREIENQTGREASDSEVASRLDVDLGEYYSRVHDGARCRLAELNNITAASMTEAAPDPFREVADEAFRGALAREIGALPEREKLVMSHYYGNGRTLKEIGRILKVTEARVWQVHGRALLRLRARLAEWSGRT
jgi:RNA polymerase sigma factor for flagellar operon FliA